MQTGMRSGAGYSEVYTAAASGTAPIKALPKDTPKRVATMSSVVKTSVQSAPQERRLIGLRRYSPATTSGNHVPSLVDSRRRPRRALSVAFMAWAHRATRRSMRAVMTSLRMNAMQMFCASFHGADAPIESRPKASRRAVSGTRAPSSRSTSGGWCDVPPA